MKAALLLLAGLFPPVFRERFGAEMREQVEQDYDAARSLGTLASLWFAIVTAVDLVFAALAEHVNPTWRAAPAITTEGEGMVSMLHEWKQDLRLAARTLARSAGFTAVAAGTLGLAIGVTAAMFGVVDTVLLNPLPFENTDRLVHIAATAPGSDLPEEFDAGEEFYLHYKEQSRLLEDISTYNSFTSTMRVGDRVERIRMSWPTNSLFSTLGVQPMLGRLPVADDESRAVLISHTLWTTWFGSDSSVIGRAYDIARERRTVIGVMGPEFKFIDNNEETMLWISLEIRAADVEPGGFDDPLVGRMKPGVTIDEVASELTLLSKGLPARFGGSANYARIIEQHRAAVRPLEQELLGPAARPLWILMGAAGIVLLIACANVANLFLVRTEGRQRELAVRGAIGATRGQLVRLQMAEALLVAGLAAAIALVMAWTGLPLFVHAAPEGVPRLNEVGIDLTLTLFTLGTACIAALACGLAPAIRASSPDLTRLRDGGRGATRGRHWGRNALIVGQTAFALVLLIGSGLLMRSFSNLTRVDPGYDTTDIFTFQIAPEREDLVDGPTFAAFAMQFMDRLRVLPGVQSVGLVENLPLNEATRSGPFRTETMTSEADAGVRLDFTFAAGDYFTTMGIALLDGEPFSPTDLASTLGKVMISRAAADRLWPNDRAIGRRVYSQRDSNWATVIGVVEDVKQNDFRQSVQPLVYYPLVSPTPRSWAMSSPAYVVRTARAEFIAPEIRSLVREVAPSAPMYRTFTMAGLARDSMVGLSFTMLVLGIASALALLLGAVGLYGVLSYVVAQRTREIGVRLALGAGTGQVRRMVVAQGARVVVLGVVIGLGVALVSARVLGSLLFEVAAVDVATYVGMSVSMVAVGLLASYMPARRASRVDPIRSLRED